MNMFVLSRVGFSGNILSCLPKAKGSSHPVLMDASPYHRNHQPEIMGWDPCLELVPRFVFCGFNMTITVLGPLKKMAHPLSAGIHRGIIAFQVSYPKRVGTPVCCLSFQREQHRFGLLKKGTPIGCWYLQGNDIIPGFLRCRISSMHGMVCFLLISRRSPERGSTIFLRSTRINIFGGSDARSCRQSMIARVKTYCGWTKSCTQNS